LQEDGALVDDDGGVPVGVIVDPVGLVQGDVDAAVAAVAGEALVATGVYMGELGAGTVVGTPPAIVYEVAPQVILDCKVDGVGGYQ